MRPEPESWKILDLGLLNTSEHQDNFQYWLWKILATVIPLFTKFGPAKSVLIVTQGGNVWLAITVISSPHKISKACYNGKYSEIISFQRQGSLPKRWSDYLDQITSKTTRVQPCQPPWESPSSHPPEGDQDNIQRSSLALPSLVSHYTYIQNTGQILPSGLGSLLQYSSCRIKRELLVHTVSSIR